MRFITTFILNNHLWWSVGRWTWAWNTGVTQGK